MWCPCVVYGKSRQRLRSLQTQGMPLPDEGETCDGHCCIFAVVGGNSWAMQVSWGIDNIPQRISVSNLVSNR